MLEKIFIKEVIAPVIIIIIFIVLYLIISRLVKRVTSLKINKTNEKRGKTIASLINNVIKYTFFILAFLMILNVYGIDTSAVLASLGVFSLVIGLALQDMLKDFISGLFIIFENQYGIGDTVSIKDFKGEVLSLGLKTTKIKAYTGEIKIISNRNIEEVINYSQESSLARIDISISYEDDIKKVEKVLTNLCKRLTNELENIIGEVTFLGISSLDESCISYRIEVRTKPLQHYEIQRRLYREVKLELDKNHITIPYKQVVIRNA